MVQWIWQKENWTDFVYDESRFASHIEQFDRNNALTLRDVLYFDNSENDDFVVYIHGLEAFLSSKIEGESIDFTSLVGSIRANFNILSRVDEDDTTSANAPRRKSIAKMMVDLYRTFDDPLTEEAMNSWNSLLTYGEEHSGAYRTYKDEMQIVALNNLCKDKRSDDDIEYQAPPSSAMKTEMDQFIDWYNKTSPSRRDADTPPIHPMIRAALAHLHFVAIHPYDDGNGRIARALAVKAISEHNGEPTLISLSHAISDTKSEYYDALKQATKHDNLDAWLDYFCRTTIRAQEISKEKLYRAAVVRTIEQHHPDLTPLQLQGIKKVAYGDTKKGGIISASEYVEADKAQIKQRALQENRGLIAIASEDLESLVQKGILERCGDNQKSFKLVYPHIPGLSRPKPYRPVPTNNGGHHYQNSPFARSV